MAFWGVVVKPGNPVTHPGKKGGRLRISQATLEFGEGSGRSVVMCKLGEREQGVFVCALVPGKMEWCHLELEFQEKHDVVFSVIGPRNVHLSGYYIHPPFPSISDSESIGANIDDSDVSTFGSTSQYGGSFINNNDEVALAPIVTNHDRGSDIEALVNDEKKCDQSLYGDWPASLFNTTRAMKTMLNQMGNGAGPSNAERNTQQRRHIDDDDTKMSMSDVQLGKKRKKSYVSFRTSIYGVTIQELESGPTHGKIAIHGKNVKIYYTGKLEENGHIFHTNVGKPAFSFVLGNDNDFINGLSAGIEGMRVGDKRRLTFPPSMGYEDKKVESIVPPDSVIIYDVELVDA